MRSTRLGQMHRKVANSTNIESAILKVGFRETLNKSRFYGEPAQLCDVGINKIKV